MNHSEAAETTRQTVSTSRKVAFNTLALGAKFRYLPDDKYGVWVKIGHDLIAKWDASKISDTWIGQSICSFSEDGNVTTLVYLEPCQ